jgi:O-antigen ligase
MPAISNYTLSRAAYALPRGAHTLPTVTPAATGWLTRVAFVCLWLFLFTMPWENQLVIPGIGTIGRVSGLAAIVVALLALIAEGTPRPMALMHVFFAAFVLWSGVSYIWAIDHSLTTERLVTNIQLLMMMLLVWQFGSDRQSLAQMMSAYVLGTLVSSFFTISNYASGVTAVYQRYAASGFDPNDLGLILALSIPMSAWLASVEPSNWRVCLYRLHLPIVLWSILLTASRGALLASLAALCFVPLTFARISRQRKVILAAAVIAVIAAGFCFAPQFALDRLSTTHSELANGTLNERRVIWQAGLQIWTEHPLTGVGAGNFGIAVLPLFGLPQAAHNLFVAVLAELGMIGLLLFAAGILDCVFSASVLPTAERWMVRALIVTLVIGVMGLEWEWRKPAWFLLALCGAWTAAPAMRKRA